MNTDSAKGRPLNKNETQALLEFIESSKIITTKTTNAANNKMKTEEWIRLAAKFNATSSIYPRTPQQLRLKWENLKKNARKRSTRIRMNQFKTGGGPPDYIPPDDILDRVTSLLGSTVSGFTVPFGGDSEPLDSNLGNQSTVVIESSGEPLLSTSTPTTFDPLESNVGIINILETSDTMPSSINKGIVDEVSDCQVLGVVDNTSHKTLTFSTPRTVKKKLKPDESKIRRNTEIAEYYKIKRQCLESKMENIKLENEYYKLKTVELNLVIEKLKLEINNIQSSSNQIL